MSDRRKILYLCGEEFIESNGIAKKITQQIGSFERLGFSVNLIHRKHQSVYFNNKRIHTITIGYINRLLYFFYVDTYLRKSNEKYELLYVRNPDWFFPTGFSWFLKRWHSETKIILEIPTYPYDSECRTLKAKLSLLLHKMQRRTLKNYVDIVAYMGEKTDSIWGIPAVKIENAIDVEKVPPLKNREAVQNKIVFIGVARLSYWHGFDRLIKAIHHYKKYGAELKVQFFIVGGGEKELARLKKLVTELGLNKEDVTFCGPLFGKELDEIFDRSHIGVDSLGRHRSGIRENSSLKSKEYLARGLPLIKSHSDISIDGLPFVFNSTPDENIIDLINVCRWYQDSKFEASKIRKYAELNFSWHVQMEKILDKLI